MSKILLLMLFFLLILACTESKSLDNSQSSQETDNLHGCWLKGEPNDIEEILLLDRSNIMYSVMFTDKKMDTYRSTDLTYNVNGNSIYFYSPPQIDAFNGTFTIEEDTLNLSAFIIYGESQFDNVFRDPFKRCSVSDNFKKLIGCWEGLNDTARRLSMILYENHSMLIENQFNETVVMYTDHRFFHENEYLIIISANSDEFNYFNVNYVDNTMTLTELSDDPGRYPSSVYNNLIFRRCSEADDMYKRSLLYEDRGKIVQIQQ